MNLNCDTKYNSDGETIANPSLLDKRQDITDSTPSNVKESEEETKEIKDPINNISHTEDADETLCGIMGFTPGWLQIFASKKAYTFLYGLLGSLQSAIGAYYVGTISTVEKRFKMPSFMSGLIASAWDVGAVFASIIVAYFGSRGHKTRWVAAGAVAASLSCFMRFLPHLIFGPGEDAVSFDLAKAVNYTGDRNMCKTETIVEESCTLDSDILVTFLIMAVAQVFLGIGTSTYYTLGAAYLDDNVLKNKVPIVFAISTGIRMIGPTIGHLIAYLTLKIYVDPSIDPPIREGNPRWIGAWWLGWAPLGCVHMSLAFLMSLFPKTLPRESERRKTSQNQRENNTETSFKDFLSLMKRLVRNPILMFNSFSSTFYFFGMMGYWTFMPKYIENMFRLSPSKSVLITGVIGLICSAIGVLVSGGIVSKIRPRAKYLAAWNVFTETVDVIGHAAFAFLGCPKEDLHGQLDDNGSWELIVDCNGNCSCSPNTKYSPVCSFDNSTTFFSPCHAGCTSSEIQDGAKVYTNCSCIPEFFKAQEGACPIDCSQDFTIFLILLCIMRFLSSTGRSGNTIIQFRAVAPEDKSVSIALTEVLVCAIAFIPAPIVYGMILDSSCLIWGYECGVRGNCWLYDAQKLGYVLNFTASTFLLIAMLFDVGVFWNIGDLKIYDEQFVDEPEEKKEDNNVKEQDAPLLNKNVENNM